MIWWHWPVGLLEFCGAYLLASRLFTRQRAAGLRERLSGYGDRFTEFLVTPLSLPIEAKVTVEMDQLLQFGDQLELEIRAIRSLITDADSWTVHRRYHQ